LKVEGIWGGQQSRARVWVGEGVGSLQEGRAMARDWVRAGVKFSKGHQIEGGGTISKCRLKFTLANPAREEKTPKWTRMSTHPRYL
jgi:hypothetical protein